MKRNKSITTLVHKHENQTIKVKHKSKGREMQLQDNTMKCYRIGNQSTWWKTFPPLNLPNVPKPSKLLLQQGFLEPCLV